MKKTIMGLALGALLVSSSIGFAFADDGDVVKNENTRGNGIRMYTKSSSVEDLLKSKIERIDELVKEGKITKEDGEKYKKTITERMKDCTTVGENRDKNERLGIGFGRGNGLGKGRGNRRGCGNGFCRDAVTK